MRNLLKILAVAVAVALIAGILFTADAFLGNPVSYALVYFNAKKYIQTTYPDADYQLDRVSYSFKFGDYYAYVKSPTKQDEHFTVTFNGLGQVEKDYYETYVSGKGNLRARLKDTYYNLTNEAFSEMDINSLYATLIFQTEGVKGYTPHAQAYVMKDIANNTAEYVKEMGQYNGSIEISMKAQDVSMELLAEKLLDVKALADEKDVQFYTISLTLFKEGENRSEIYVRYFQYEDIYEEGLVERVQKSHEDYLKILEEERKEKEELKNAQV
ncbi:MAG: hypothetical protein IJW96_03450 [Clostridia bacterium]|nr:hypothetical protein [Clostridia bacterium]